MDYNYNTFKCIIENVYHFNEFILFSLNIKLRKNFRFKGKYK